MNDMRMNSVKEQDDQERIFLDIPKCRCLTYHQRETEDIYMRLCGIEEEGSFEVAKSRPGYHLHVVLSGKGTMYVNDTKIHIRSGQLFVTKPGEPVRYKADKDNPWMYCWMTFDGNLAKEYAEKCGFVDGVYVLDSNVDTYRFYEIVKYIVDHTGWTRELDLMRLGKLLEYISLAMESYNKSEQGTKNDSEYSPDVYVDYALEFIRFNYRTIKVSDIAKYIGINRSYLSNTFKAKMGVSPQKYLVEYRLREAARMIRETDQPIQDISRKVGYTDPLTFSKMFKKMYGVSPRKYRSEDEQEEI